MQHQEHIHEDILENQQRDFSHNWVTSSRFLFYVQVFCIVAFLFGGCYSLYMHRYHGKPGVEVPGSSQYTPQYK
jgi:hypothetical protein